MLKLLKELDTSLFYFINVGLANPFFDFLMPLVTELKHWAPIYLLGFIFLIYKYRIRGLVIIILLLLTAGVSDQIGGLLKEHFQRLRPCWELQDINLLVPCGQGKSFPSNHATNNFGAAIILTYFFRNKWYYFYTCAFLVAISRIFIGVHYPLDILGGMALGSVVGLSFILLYNQLLRIEKVRAWVGEE